MPPARVVEPRIWRGAAHRSRAGRDRHERNGRRKPGRRGLLMASRNIQGQQDLGDRTILRNPAFMVKRTAWLPLGRESAEDIGDRSGGHGGVEPCLQLREVTLPLHAFANLLLHGEAAAGQHVQERGARLFLASFHPRLLA